MRFTGIREPLQIADEKYMNRVLREVVVEGTIIGTFNRDEYDHEEMVPYDLDGKVVYDSKGNVVNLLNPHKAVEAFKNHILKKYIKCPVCETQDLNHILVTFKVTGSRKLNRIVGGAVYVDKEVVYEDEDEDGMNFRCINRIDGRLCGEEWEVWHEVHSLLISGPAI